MKIQNSVALVTGANRGLGLTIAQELLAAGARKVYAAARDISTVQIDGVVPIQLDVTDPASVAAAAEIAQDVTLLVNNAGIALGSNLFSDATIDAARRELETNYFGPLLTSRAFAPILARNGGGAIANVLSVLSWINAGWVTTYSPSKAAAWSLTNGLRDELRSQGTQVLGLHVGLMDTDMAKGFDLPKTSPIEVARQLVRALDAGEEEVLADEISRQVKQGLSDGVYLRANR